jgi:hypothetical protein
MSNKVETSSYGLYRYYDVVEDDDDDDDDDNNNNNVNNAIIDCAADACMSIAVTYYNGQTYFHNKTTDLPVPVQFSSFEFPLLRRLRYRYVCNAEIVTPWP